jgi:flagellar M-ring protein FliF
MAELPLETPVGGPSVPGANFLRGAMGMPMVRQVTLLIAISASVALAVFAIFWMQQPDYRPLTGPLEPAATAEVIDSLETNGIDYQLDQRNGLVLVAGQDYYTARMALGGSQVIDQSQRGYELLDQEQGFGVSQFMEKARHRRSIEGELARSITTIDAILQARVLLATPKASNFLRERRKPKASVIVTLRPGRRLGEDQVRAIANLVAGSVEALESRDVVVVDQSGQLLSDGTDDQSYRQTQRELNYVQRLETQLHDKISNILLPWIGGGRFTAEVNASVDFTRLEQTEESYSPDQTAIRSEERLEEQKTGNELNASGVPGTLSNEPPEFGDQADASQAADRQTSSRLQSTRNYELDRTISHTKHASGQVQRLSVSVVVDDMPQTDAETGELTLTSWSAEELNELTAAVKSAVGFQEERGDSVSVVNKSFYREPETAFEPTPMWAEAWFSDLLKQVLGGIAIILIVFGLLRPMFKNLSQAGEMVREQQSLAIADLSQARESAMQQAVPGLPMPISFDSDESSAAKMETVRNLITEDPNRVAQVVKHWVSDNE